MGRRVSNAELAQRMSTLGRRVGGGLAALIMLWGLAGCFGSQNEAVDTSGISKVTLTLTMGSAVSAKPAIQKAEAPARAPISGVKIIVTVSGPDLASQLTFTFENTTIDTETPTSLQMQVPAGSIRIFVVGVYASNGSLLLEANMARRLDSGQVTLQLPLLPAPVPAQASSGTPATQLMVLSQTPADLAWNISTTSPSITAAFNRPLNAGTVTTTTFSLKDSQGATVSGSVGYTALTSTATFTPSAALTANRTFTALLSATIADSDGRALGRAVPWSFRTGEFALASLVSVNVSATRNCSACHRAAVGPDGRIHVAWVNETRIAGLGLGTLYYKNAAAWLSSFLPVPPRVVATGPELGKFPDMAVDGLGSVTIVWTAEGAIGGGTRLAAAARGIYALALDPTPSPAALPIVYAGTGAGLVKSLDGGTRWEVKDTGMLSAGGQPLTVYALAPPLVSSSGLLYAGTSAGVFRTSDGGETWTALSSGVPAGAVKAFLVHPTLSSILYAGTERAGVFRSRDSGNTWLPVNTGLTDREVRGLAFDPTNPAILYAGTVYPSGGLFKSLDQGDHWTLIGSPETGLAEPHAYVIVVDPTDPTLIYAGTDQGVYYSTNGGATWTLKSQGIRGPLGLFPGVPAIVLHPTTHTTVFAGGGCCSDGVYRTDDGGGQWKPLNHGLSPAHIHTIAIDPKRPSVLYAGGIGNGGGVYVSVDGGANWTVSLGTSREIFISRSTDNGTTFSVPANLSQTGGYSDTPRVATDSANRVHVVWRDDTPGNAEIAYSRSTDGTTFPLYTNLSNTAGLSMQPSLAIVGATVGVVWQEDGAEVWFTRSTDSGATFPTPAKNISNTAGASDSPKIAIDGSGTFFHVVWRDETYGNSEILYARSSDGMTFSAPKNLSDSPGFSALPDLAVVGSGALASVYVVWRDLMPDKNAEVFYAESTDGGATFSAPKNLSGTPVFSTEPHVITAPGGAVYVSWREDIGETALGTGDLEVVMGRLK